MFYVREEVRAAEADNPLLLMACFAMCAAAVGNVGLPSSLKLRLLNPELEL